MRVIAGRVKPANWANLYSILALKVGSQPPQPCTPSHPLRVRLCSQVHSCNTSEV